MRSAIKTVALATLLALAGADAQAQDAKPAADGLPGDDKTVVVRIDGEPIHMSRLQRALEIYGRDLSQLSPAAYYRTVMDRMIDQELAARAAALDGLEQVPEVKARLEEARANVLASAYLRKVAAAATTEEELRRRYEASAKEGEKRVSARHILVQTESKAMELIAALKGGADFAFLAKEHSVGPSGKNGGDLGFFSKGQMVKPFADAAFALEKGAFTETPVETRFGWHVILVEDIQRTPPPSYAQAHDKLADEVRTEAMLNALNTLRENAKIERFGPDGEPLEP